MTTEEKAELERELDALADKLSKRLMSPIMRIVGGQLGLAAWMSWHFWGHIPAAILGTLGFIVWALGWAAKWQGKS